MLQWLGHRLGLVLSCYFDDFVLLSGRELAPNSEASFKLLLDLLGWDFDKDGDKADSISEEVTALGVEAIAKGQMSKASYIFKG